MRLAAYLIAFCLAAFSLAVPHVAAQERSPVPAVPPQVDELVRLLEDPAIRTWLEQAKAAQAPVGERVEEAEAAASAGLAARLSGVREHVRTVVNAVPRIPGEAARAGDLLMQDLRGRGLLKIVLLLAAFVAFGYGSETVFYRATTRTRTWIGSHPMGTVPQRLRAIGLRLGFGLALVAIFALGSVGAFLAFEWPPMLKDILLTYLVAILILRLTLILGRVVLVAGRARARQSREISRHSHEQRQRALLVSAHRAVRRLFRLRPRDGEPSRAPRLLAGGPLGRGLSARPRAPRHRLGSTLEPTREGDRRCRARVLEPHGRQRPLDRLRRPALGSVGRRIEWPLSGSSRWRSCCRRRSASGKSLSVISCAPQTARTSRSCGGACSKSVSSEACAPS